MNKNLVSSITSMDLLLLLFIGLKLGGVISWSWLWVLSPMWVPAGIVLVILVFLLIWEKLFD